MSVLKRQREAKKRMREKRKAEKAALKRERRHGKKSGTAIATREELEGIGVLVPRPGGGRPEVEESIDDQLNDDFDGGEGNGDETEEPEGA